MIYSHMFLLLQVTGFSELNHRSHTHVEIHELQADDQISSFWITIEGGCFLPLEIPAEPALRRLCLEWMHAKHVFASETVLHGFSEDELPTFILPIYRAVAARWARRNAARARMARE